VGDVVEDNCLTHPFDGRALGVEHPPIRRLDILTAHRGPRRPDQRQQARIVDGLDDRAPDQRPAIDAKRLLGGGIDQQQPVLGIEYDHAVLGLGQNRFQLAPFGIRPLVQACVLDGDGGVVGHCRQHGQRLIGEGVADLAIIDPQHADDLIADRQRDVDQ
jgi:hypothetical protein